MNIQGFSPTINAPMQAQAASTTAASGSSGSSSNSDSSNALSSSDLESTFLNLLVTELQNQDPTQPVDPTEMVSQMVSLNQLDQLISINQTLTAISQASSTSGTSGSGTQGSLASNPVSAAVPGAGKTSTPGSAITAQAATTTIPTTPGGLMNLYGNIGAPGNHSINAAQGGR